MPQRLKDELGTQEPALPGNALNWIGREWVDAKQRKKSFDRATGEEIGSYADASRDDVQSAMSIAARTFRTSDWKRIDACDRRYPPSFRLRRPTRRTRRPCD